MRIPVFFLLVIISMTSLAQQAEPLKFNEKIHDFGTIREDGGSAECEFTFINNSGLTVTVVSVQASCGCTTPGWSKDPIEPGKSGFVKASYNPIGRPGFFNRTLTVATNLEGPPIVLQIKGQVTNADIESDVSRFTTKSGSLQFRSKSINFGKVFINKAAVTQEVPLYNAGEKPVTITSVETPAYITAEAPGVVNPGTTAVVKLSYNAMLKNQYGFAADNLELVTDDELLPRKSFPVYATIEEFFLPVAPEESGKVPVMKLSATSLEFGTLRSGSASRADVKIRNTGHKDLTIRFVQPNCSCVSAVLSGDKIKAGEEQTIAITWKGEGRRGTQNKAITVYSTDPVNPIQRISLSGQVN